MLLPVHWEKQNLGDVNVRLLRLVFQRNDNQNEDNLIEHKGNTEQEKRINPFAQHSHLLNNSHLRNSDVHKLSV